MQHRTLALAITPVHRSGMLAPAIMVNAATYVDAKKEAYKKSHLCKSYPSLWSVI